MSQEMPSFGAPQEVKLRKQESQESISYNIENAIREQGPDAAKREAVRRLKEKFSQRLEEEYAKNGKHPLDYHGPDHSINFAERYVADIAEIRTIDPSLATEEDELLAETHPLFHDQVMESSFPNEMIDGPDKDAEGKPIKIPLLDAYGNPVPGMRARNRGFYIPANDNFNKIGNKGKDGNEYKSAELELAELEKFQYEDGTPVFPEAATSEFRDKVFRRIGMTYPAVNLRFTSETALAGESRTVKGELFEEKYGKGVEIYQPLLDENTSIPEILMAHEDLRRAAGSLPYPEFKADGNKEFREIWEKRFQWIVEKLAHDDENLTDDTKRWMDDFAQKIIGWRLSQVFFGLNARNSFYRSLDENTLINGLPEEKRDAVKAFLINRFATRFDDNILEAKKEYEELTTTYTGKVEDIQTFKALLGEAGWNAEELIPSRIELSHAA